MSVSQLTVRDFSTFLAIAIRQQFTPASQLGNLVGIMEQISLGNCAAWADSYSDTIPAVSADDIERETLKLLADKANPLQGHISSIVYNVMSQRGNEFYGMLEASPESLETLASVKLLETKCHEWQKTEARRIERQAQDDKAYSEIGPCDALSGAEIAAKCRAAGCARVIIAEFWVDQSDLMTDYHGGRSGRRVVIGFGKGKRENFLQLRAAAAEFEPTKHLAPGCDNWRVRVWTEADQGPNHYRQSYVCHLAPYLKTEQEAREWVGSQIVEKTQDGMRAESYGFELVAESVEHRENYSMGGGNYLGLSRYSGWRVDSEPVAYYEPATDGRRNTNSAAMYEYFEPVRKVGTDGKPIVPPAPKQERKPAAAPVFTTKGYLSNGYDVSQKFHKEETAQKAAAKLRKLGYGVEVEPTTGAWGRSAFRVKMTSEPTHATASAPIEETHATASAPIEPATSAQFTIQKQWHEKLGKVFWLVVPTSRLEMEVYQATLTAARKAGGWQARKWGKSPSGFGFETDAAALAFVGAHASQSAPIEAVKQKLTVLSGWQQEIKAQSLKGRLELANDEERKAQREGRAHTLTYERWVMAVRANESTFFDMDSFSFRTHREYVAEALAKGEHVPTEVLADHSDLAPPAPATASAPIIQPSAPATNPTMAAKLRTLADKLTKDIEHATRPLSQNWTPKRGRELASRMFEGHKLTRAQAALYALADAWEAGTVPRELTSITTKRAVLELVPHKMDRNHRTDEIFDTGEPSNNSPQAVALRQLIESSKTDADHAAQAEAKRADEIRQAENALRAQNIDGFFPTPPALAARMVEAAELSPGLSVLEPSAGIGSLCEAIREECPGATIQSVELRPSLVAICRLKGLDVFEGDFLEFAAGMLNGAYDRVIMNPPFERGADADHVRAAYGCLKWGGRLVAIMSEGTFSRSDRKATEFRDWLEFIGGTSERVEHGAFSGSEAFRQTGVACRLVVIDNPLPAGAEVSHATQSAPIEDAHASQSAPDLEFVNWL